ncbi:NUDIX hydrolase [Granulicoccus phenolivorans]|uniref:NUDIX hydrolase n=1 Tax=Granulicoccus phenolivorans TaxID=266854 RepID=UPI000400901F|nr:NUDIX domain-containing protein [Granulicoccus phenolivorans]
MERDYIAVDPAARPIRTRVAVRLVVLAQERVLLLADTDPGTPGSLWWTTPGGGMDPGESERGTGVRELWEETGLQVAESELIGPLGDRVAIHGYSDQVAHQRETFFAVRLERPFELDTSNHTADERLTLQQWRWWPLAELVDPDAEIWPAYLLRLVDLIDRPDQRPVAFGMTEESSVPVLPGQFPSGGGNGQGPGTS